MKLYKVTQTIPYKVLNPKRRRGKPDTFHYYAIGETSEAAIERVIMNMVVPEEARNMGEWTAELQEDGYVGAGMR